ncbi:MAG: hypothetical protein K0S93_1273 [Nitrososphaeraceae archaeon]|nr:hypothetical protein [Nitrososphaeraceae archaeon]
MPYIITGIICIKSPLLTRETIANIIEIMLIMRVIVLAHLFPFKSPHETMKLAIPSPTNIKPPIVTSNPSSLVEESEESMLIKVPKNKGAIPVNKSIIPPSIIRTDIIVIPVGRC